MSHLRIESGAAKAFLAARDLAGQFVQGESPTIQKPDDWSHAFSVMAHFYPAVDLAEIDEQQLAGYLQHVSALSKMQASSLAALLAPLLKR